MNARRLLQGFDDVSKQAFLNLMTVVTAGSFADRVADKKISDDALALLINKEGVAEDAAPLDGRIAGKNLGIHVAQDHLGGGSVVPREQPSPQGDLIFQQRSKVGGREMSEIENFHNKCPVLRFQCQ